MELSKIAETSVRGTLYLVVGTASSTIIAAVASILIARLLGPPMYGLYSLAFVLPALFASIIDFGLSDALTRFAASFKSQQRYARLASMMSSGLFFRLIASSAAFLLAVGFSSQLAAFVLQRQNMEQLVAVASVMIIFQGLFDLSYETLVGLDRMDQSALIGILRDVVRGILSPVLIVVGLGVVGAVTGRVLGYVIAGLLGVWLLLTHRRALREISRGSENDNALGLDIHTMMSYGLPLYIGSLLATVLDQYENIILAFFTSNAEIGNFNAAVNFTALIGIVSMSAATALFPAFSKLDLETRKEDLQKMFQQSVRYTTLLIVPVAVFLATLSRDLIVVVYGADYSHASTYLALYVGIFLLTGLGYQVMGNFLSGIGRTKDTLKIAVVQLIIFLPSAPAMTWLFRVPGLIVALLISGLVAASFGLWLATGTYGMQVDFGASVATLVVAVVSTLPVLLFLYSSALPALANVLISAPIYLAAYLTLAPAFRAVRRTDLKLLAPVLGQIRILGAASRLIFAYETRLLNAFEQKTNAAGELK